MASLQAVSGVFYVRFRLSGQPFRRTLDTKAPETAEILLKQVEVNLHRIGVGTIPTSPEDADVTQYVLTGGKDSGKNVANAAPKPLRITLEQLRQGYDVRMS